MEMVTAIIFGYNLLRIILSADSSFKVNKAVMTGLGVCTLYIGISGSLCGENALLVIASVVLGAIAGTLLNIDGGINALARKIEAKVQKNSKSGSVAEGWVTATLLFCVGSMTVTGSLQSGLTADHSILITKAMLDLVSAMMLASSLGAGVLLSAFSVLVIQGGLVALAGLLSPFLSTGAINEMTCVGSLLIIMIGTNLMGLSKLKVADYLPAILFAPILYNLLQLF